MNVTVMYFVNILKLKQHYDRFSKVLLDTKNYNIVELSYKDFFWGAYFDYDRFLYIGHNKLGHILMNIRELILTNSIDKFLLNLNLSNIRILNETIHR